MSYIITGATSFLGVELVQTLLQQSHQVIVICRPGSQGVSHLPKGVKTVYAQLDEYGTLDTKIAQADVFVHLAWAGTGHDGRDATQVQQENIAYSLDAMRAAAKMGCKLFVMAGSQAEYGSTTLPQQEEMPCAPFSEYGKAKLQMWEEGKQLAAALGMKYLHLRIFSLFGETDHAWTLVMSCVDKMLRNEPMELSACTQNWNFLYVNDAARQISALCNYAVQREDYTSEIYQIASEDTRPLKDFVERMKILTGSKSDLHYGAVVPAHLVSLQPDMHKTQAVVGSLAEYDFDAVIKRIIDKHYDKSI